MENLFEKWFPQEIVEQSKKRIESLNVEFERSTILPNIHVFSGHLKSPIFSSINEIWGRVILFFRVIDLNGREIAEIEFKNSDGEFERSFKMALKTPGTVPEAFFDRAASICADPLFKSHRTGYTRDITENN